MQIIPSRQDSQYRQEIELNGTIFVLIMSWNVLKEFWTLSLFTRDLMPIVLGIKVVNQFNLTEQLVQEGMPSGDILCQSIIGSFEKIRRNDLGEFSELIFYPVD